ncbi:MAG: selenocysteine-specific translation elongation factor, partial [Nitrospirae bacterium]|nr:selenocysteine-specific translation elongation factor [Nitrospirota bacterium]
MKHVILGTAGHIDHGKSTLVKALTGIDPDRLKEEKARGITIDLGFADLRYEDLIVGFVDVPGHERLIKNMLAGAGGIDIVLFTIAADEGVMPQSREHLAICHLLGIREGIIAITKSDLVDEELLEVVIEETKDFVKGTFLDNAAILPVSAKDGTNIETLRQTIHDISMGIKPKSSKGLFRLPIDRVFTLKGFGTVVTGTAISGTVSIDDHVELLPAGLKAKVRGLQSHNEFVQRAVAGQRLAVNLQGIDREDAVRGDVLAIAGTFGTTRRMDAYVELLKTSVEIKNRAQVHLHIGTSEIVSRLIIYGKEKLLPGDSGYCQLRFGEPLVAMRGDRFILRRLSPLDTIGGGVVADPFPPKKTNVSSLEVYLTGTLEEKLSEKIKNSGIEGLPAGIPGSWGKEDLPEVEHALRILKSRGVIVEIGDTVFHCDVVKGLSDGIVRTVSQYHKKFPLKPGVSREELKSSFKAVDSKTFFEVLSAIGELSVEKDFIRLKSFKPLLTSVDEKIREKVLQLLKDSGFQPPFKEELPNKLEIKPAQLNDLLKLLTRDGAIIRINDSIYLSKAAYDAMMDLLKKFAESKKEITVAEFRDLLGTSRKYALPYLEYMDGKKITMRVGDLRKILS